MFFKRQIKTIVYAPLSGTCVSLQDVPDEAFSQNLMGLGIAIIPSVGKVFAPFDGYTSILSDTNHALGLMSKTGIDLLIHVGLETVQLAGKYYIVHTKENASFKKGDLLLEFDIVAIKAAGYNIITPVTVTNSAEFETVDFLVDITKGITIDAGSDFIQITKGKNK